MYSEERKRPLLPSATDVRHACPSSTVEPVLTGIPWVLDLISTPNPANIREDPHLVPALLPPATRCSHPGLCLFSICGPRVPFTVDLIPRQKLKADHSPSSLHSNNYCVTMAFVCLDLFVFFFLFVCFCFFSSTQATHVGRGTLN